MMSIVQRSPRISMARPTEQDGGRSSSYMNGNGSGSGAERRQLPGQSDRIVVRDQEAGGVEHPQLRMRQQGERLLGDLHRVQRILVGPQQQRRDVDPAVRVEQFVLGARGPAPRGL